jgi:hypothetical protein
VVDPVFLDSPLLHHPALDEALGLSCSLKIETLNPVRSFKGRGTEAAALTILPLRDQTHVGRRGALRALLLLERDPRALGERLVALAGAGAAVRRGPRPSSGVMKP